MSRNPRTIVFLLLLPALALLLPPAAKARDVTGPELAKRLAKAGPNEPIPVIIVMKDRPDVAALEAAAAGKTKAERRRAVLGLLKTHSAASQKEIRTLIEEKTPPALAKQVKYLWINNTVAGWIEPSLIREIARRSDVESVRVNIPRQAFMGARKEWSPPESLAARPSATGGSRGRDIAWGVTWIRADQAWATYGVHGTGVKVAMVDTGCDYFHSDLENRIWVNPGEDMDHDGVVWDQDDLNGVDDDGNGYVDDLIGYDFGMVDNNPMDDDGHGTHTSGTVAGDGTAGTQTGVAPGAKLMICKAGYYVTYTDEASIWEAWQYAADNGADVLSMSMGWLQEWLPHRVTWRQTAQIVKLAGTTLVIAAGNERNYYWIQAPDNIRTPGDCPEVICVGATSYMNNNYAYFSSYGPTEWYESPFFDYPYPPGLVKPDIMAPGEDINSTMWGGGYSGNTWSGTSMATPHVAGVCALMLEANPALTPDEVQQIMEDNGIDLGPAGKDNDYGSGLVDAPDCVLGAINHGPHGPIVDIKVDGDDGPLNVSHTQTVQMTISLDPGTGAGVPHDWWIFGEMNSTYTFWWRYPGTWTYSPTPRLAYNGALIPLTDYTFAAGKIPMGTWIFTFAVDDLNGVYEGTYSDTIDVYSW